MKLHSLKNKMLLLILLVLSGCVVGPNFTPPVVDVPDSYRTPVILKESANDLQWWALFDDPQLNFLISTALEHNRNVKIAISRIAQARATVGFTRADQFPRFEVEAGAQKGTFSGGSISASSNTTYFLAAPLTWEVDFWGKLRRSTDATRAELIASDYGLKSVQISLITEVASSYYQLLDFHQRLAISQSTLKSRKDSLEIIEQRFAKGIISELDVNQAQIQKEIAAASIPFYERSIARTENKLSILTGRLPTAITIEESLIGQPSPPIIPAGLPSDLLINRPDISEAMYLLNAQTERIGMAQAMRFPSFSMTGVLGVASTEIGSITTDGDTWSVGGGLLGPLFDFDKNKNRVEIEKQKTQQALFQYENTVLIAFREVEDALIEITTYRHELASGERQQKAAKNANTLSKERYDKGVSSYLEVLDSERTLFSAELQLSELQRQYRSAYVNLYKALGGGWITKAEREAFNQPKNFNKTP